MGVEGRGWGMGTWDLEGPVREGTERENNENYLDRRSHYRVREKHDTREISSNLRGLLHFFY